MPFWAILVLVVVAATGSDATKPKPISISLRAKWEGTPLLLEAGEFLAREDAALYWKFLAAWPHASPDANSSARPASAAPSPSDGDCLDALLRVASSFLAPPLAPLLRLALAMRSLSPALLLHRQLARLSLSQAGLLGPHGAQEGTAEGEQAGWGAGGGDGGERWRVSENPAAPKGHCCWVELQGKVLLGEAEVAAALAPVQAEESVTRFAPISTHSTLCLISILISVTPPRITSLNRALPSRSCCTALPSPHRGASAPSAAPAAEHGAAVHAFDHGAIRLVLRPVLPAGCEQHVERCAAVGAGGRVSLGGYGVELALKNMEYKALDDSKLHKDGAGQAAAEGSADDLAQPVKGFLFHTLVQRYPEQTGELLTFRDQLLAAEEIRDEYNVWELKDLGIQATQRIVGGAEPLRLMQDINQNFPKIMASLAKTKARAARSPFPPCADDKGLQYIVECEQVDSTVEEAVQEMHGMVQAGRTIVALNSIAFNLATLDIFTSSYIFISRSHSPVLSPSAHTSLLEAVQAELSLGAQLLSLKVSRPFSHCLLCQLYAAALAISRWPRPASPPPSTSLLPRFLLSPTITPPVSLAIPISSCPVSPCTPLATHQLPAPVVRQLLHLPPASAAREEGGSPRLDFRSPWHVHFFNDLERDREYRGWSPNMHELLMPMYPGQFRPIRKNIFHAVFVLDPMHPSTPKAVAHIHKLHRGSMPLRMGVILASSARLLTLNDPSAPPPHHDLSELAMALFLHIKDSVGVRPAFDFLLSMWGGSGADESVDDYEDAMVTLPLPQYTPPDQPTMEAAFLHTLSAAAAVSQGGSLGSDDARRAALASVLAARQRVEGGDADSEEGGGEQGGAGGGGAAAAVWAQVVGSSRFVSGLGLADAMPCLLFNGVFYPSPKVPGGALEAMQEEMEAVQRAVYYQQIRGSSDVLAFFLASAAKRFNPEVALPAGKTAPYVSLAPPMAADNPALTRLSFLHSPGTEDEVKPFSHLLALDLSSHQGVDLLLQAVLHLESEEGTHARVAVLHNPLHAPATADARLPPLAWRHLVPRLIMAAVQMPSRRSKLPAFLRSLLQLPLLRTVVSRTHSGTEEEGWAGRGEVRSEKEGLELLASAWSIADEAGLNRAELERAVTGAGAAEAAAAHMAQDRLFVKQHCGASPGSSVIITNGRLLAPQHRFVAADFALLEEVESKRVKPALSVLQDLPSWPHLPPDLPLSDHVSGMAMVVASALSSAERASGDYVQFARLTASPSIGIIHSNDSALLHIDGVIDPLSAEAQQVTPLLLLLHEWFNPSLRIFMNPLTSISEFPLKNFYRYAAPHKELADASGVLAAGAEVEFLNMPLTRTLTLNLKVPEPWLVEPAVADHDLDNLVLEKVADPSVAAVFELEALMITGHCYEESDMQEPPRGMQLVLGTPPPVPSALLNHSSAPATAAATSSNGAAGRPQGLVVSTALEDTIVMANLGYFQLKAAPGLWLLQLAPGRSQTLYQLAGEGALGGSGGGGAEAGRGGEKEGDEGMGAVGRVAMEVAVMDLRGKVVQLRVVKRAGMEGEKMLDGAGGEDGDDEQQAEPAAAASLFGSFFQKLTGKKPAAKGEGAAANSTINIFSIASGHLYERFTRIMILSVLKNTRRPVKFWFIKNYLSPSFKEVIPHMAREYGFEYGLITYKWPSWLHKQTEKQRLIWAYKILFLDVIFPLSLQKVIFVDADQVVREDMGRLYDMPLHGHPLAYTPMCDNNRDMEGYRFWKQGFWRDHLRGKPYHISALYVVDLVRFRRMAAGDTLRVIYESLSKDPNSLANLDQDLPNYAQHTVPILSLPQEWLWCESWCGNATKARAKTIDLCNNPMTKEPKLQGARRIVAEWGALDEEQRHFTERVTRGEFDDLPPSAPRGTLRFTGFHSAPRPEEGPVREAMTEEEEGGVDDMDGVSEGEQEREEGEEGGEEGGEGGEEAGDWAGYEVDTAYEDLEGLEEIAVEAVDGVEEGEEGGEEEDEEELGHEEL
ncbi:unnamed protein product [Closterium sp. NIES-64]|nr:unnamed protein product [Closterium sp. NIES-64]